MTVRTQTSTQLEAAPDGSRVSLPCPRVDGMRFAGASLGVTANSVPGTTLRSRLPHEPEGVYLLLWANNFDGRLLTELPDLGRIDTGCSESRFEIGKTRINSVGSRANPSWVTRRIGNIPRVSQVIPQVSSRAKGRDFSFHIGLVALQ